MSNDAELGDFLYDFAFADAFGFTPEETAKLDVVEAEAFMVLRAHKGKLEADEVKKSARR